MIVNYKKWKDYKECPKRYFLRYKKENPKVQKNYKLYESLLDEFFYTFTNIWRYKTPYMPPVFIKKKLNVLYNKILKQNNTDWIKNLDEFFEEAYQDTCEIMDSHNQNLFLNSRANIEMSATTKTGIKLTGKIDYIHEDPISREKTLFVGKGSKKTKNVNTDELFFNTLLYYFATNEIINQTGFFYYRFNTMVPIIIDPEALNEFRAKLSLSLETISLINSFEAKPKYKWCKYCEYNSDCIEFLKRKKSKKSSININGLGVHEIGF